MSSKKKLKQKVAKVKRSRDITRMLVDMREFELSQAQELITELRRHLNERTESLSKMWHKKEDLKKQLIPRDEAFLEMEKSLVRLREINYTEKTVCNHLMRVNKDLEAQLEAFKPKPEWPQ